ncbi:MAG: serine hydrolase domain-containing protein [Ferruginibacter sp.]
MKKNIVSFLLTMFLLLLAAVSIKAQSNIESRIDSLFSHFNEKTPGYAVAIVQNGKLLYQQGYGMANLEYDEPITPKTVFHLASVSKVFTSFAIHQLIARKKLAPDDSVRKYFPGFPSFNYPVTIKNLLQHSSGLRDQWVLFSLCGIEEPSLITQDMIVSVIKRQTQLNFRPGDRFMYSNSGYTALAEIVKNCSQLSFPDYMVQNIFQPAGMNNSFINFDYQAVVKHKACSYAATDDSWIYKKQELNYPNYGATSMFSSVEDLGKWLIELSNLKNGSKDILMKMAERAILNNGDTSIYGSGIFNIKYKGLTRIFHDGVDAGYRSFIGYFPDENLGIAVLTNLGDADPTFRAMQIADIVLNLPPNSRVVLQPPSAAYHNLPEAKFPSYTGSYETPGDSLIKIFQLGSQLFMKRPRISLPDTLRSINDSVFYGYADVLLTFKNKSLNKYNTISFKGRFTNYQAKRVEYPVYSETELNKFTGTYYSDELQTAYDVVNVNRQLYLRHLINGDIKMEVRSRNKFSTKWSTANRLEFLNDKKGEMSGLFMNNDRALNNLFRKIK